MSAKTAKKKAPAVAVRKDPDFTFGMEPESSEHHFLVNIAPEKNGNVHISEHFEVFESAERKRIEYNVPLTSEKMRVILPRSKWDAIEDTVRIEFNQRLKRAGSKPSKFKTGVNILPRLFGKELILLCWAIEEADPGLIPIALRNWQGLKPEERWWLFTMTNAATGQALRGRNIGWRKSIRYALTENPVSGIQIKEPEFFGLKDRIHPVDSDSARNLFRDTEA